MNKRTRALIIMLFMLGLAIALGILGIFNFNCNLIGWAIINWLTCIFDIFVAYIWFYLWKEEGRIEDWGEE